MAFSGALLLKKSSSFSDISKIIAIEIIIAMEKKKVPKNFLIINRSRIFKFKNLWSEFYFFFKNTKIQFNQNN